VIEKSLKIWPAVLLALSPIAAQAEMRDSVSLEEVVVTGTRDQADPRFLPTTVQVVGRTELTRNHQVSILPTLMQQVPGLFVTSRGMLGYGASTGAAGNIAIRGLSGSSGQLMVLIDGHPQYNGIYGHPIADSYQTLLADHVEVVEGPASLLYGSNAMGGVVNIVTRKPATDGNHLHAEVGAGSYGTVQTEVADQLRVGKFSLTTAGQYARTDNHRPHMGFEQYGGMVKAEYKLSDIWNIYGDLNITHFNSRYPGSTSTPIYGAAQWITRGAANLSLQNHFSKSRGEFSLFTDFGRHKIDDGSSDEANPSTRYFRSRDNVMGISLWEAFDWVPGGLLTVGADYQHIYGRAYYTSKATGEVLDTPNKQSGHSHRNEVAGYLDLRQNLWQWLTLEAGVRVDHHSVTGTEWIPQAGVVVRPNSFSELKATATKGFRNPTMRELYLYPTSTEDLKPERLWSYELSWHSRLMQGNLRYGVTLFYMNGDNIIQVIERKNVNTGKIENSGLELEASLRLGNHWDVSTNHSFLHEVHHVVASPEYKGFVGVDFHQGKWVANTGLTIVSGLFKSVGTNEQKENFCLLNATLGYFPTHWMQLWVRGENLLAESYEINLGYPMPRATFMGGVTLHI
jgi:iron complex outermembrane receptor protein